MERRPSRQLRQEHSGSVTPVARQTGIAGCGGLTDGKAKQDGGRKVAVYERFTAGPLAPAKMA